VIIHVDGPPGGGKTAFVERLLGALDGWVFAVRCRRDESLRQARESSSARDPEVRRYRAAGASDAGRFTFPSSRDSADDFFTSRLLTDVSDVVVIEGDSPLRDADLRVFVASPPATGQTLLVRERRDRAAQQRARAAAMERLLGEPDGAARLLEQLVVVRWSRSRGSGLNCWNRRGWVCWPGSARSAPLRRWHPRSIGRSLWATRGSSMRSWS
jgi:molybdopterin-guanine dinucleotide biosynthesis protein